MKTEQEKLLCGCELQNQYKVQEILILVHKIITSKYQIISGS